MPRANRYYLPGNIWHITHRCHKKDFLLRFKRERLSWLHWLYEARKRFNVSVLNYMVTCNHIHLLVMDNSGDLNIPKFMQLLQSRTAQEYNCRKDRKGAFWEDRYHATAIDSDVYLIRCMTYISINMVRAGVVNHPLEWRESGYFEIEYPKRRYRIIDYDALAALLSLKSVKELQKSQREWIGEAIERRRFEREPKWTESLAVGSENFVEKIKEQLDIRAKSRTIEKSDNEFILSEDDISYNALFGIKNTALR
jgi:putative transposase